MSKKEKNKLPKIEELKAEAVEAEALNEEIKEGGVAEESKEESATPAPKKIEEKVLNGTPRFNKFNK